MAKTKNFLVSTADFAFYSGGQLACTGTTNLNTSIEVSMQEQNVNGGKGNKLVYTYKYGRELSATLEAADWKLAYLAASVGQGIAEQLSDVYHIAECVDIVNGIGTLKDIPIGDVAVELESGAIETITPTGSTIDLSSLGVTSGMVQATYKYNAFVKMVTIDADSMPLVGTLILDADKHNNKLGKVGSVQIHIPSYQLDGNFNIEFTPEGVTSTNMNGKALAVGGEKCADGSDVYAYVKEFDTTASALSVSDIAATPAVFTLAVGAEKELSVIGLKGGMYYPVQLTKENGVTFATDAAGVATVSDEGAVKAVSAGTAEITVTYGDHKDVVKVTVGSDD